jgi:hypothetical protein
MTQTNLDPSVLFETAVFESFSFLEQEYGFSKKVSRPNQYSVFARYENAVIYVNLMFGSPAYEPEMSFGRLGLDDIVGAFSFEAGDLIQLDSSQGWSKSAENADRIKGQVAWFALLLRECGHPCLDGDSATYSEMKSRRNALVSTRRSEVLDKVRVSKSNAA